MGRNTSEMVHSLTQIKMQAICQVSPLRLGYPTNNSTRGVDGTTVSLSFPFLRVTRMVNGDYFRVIALYSKRQVLWLGVALYICTEFVIAVWTYSFPGDHRTLNHNSGMNLADVPSALEVPLVTRGDAFTSK